MSMSANHFYNAIKDVKRADGRPGDARILRLVCIHTSLGYRTRP